MAFKKKAVVNARLDQLSKAELIRTVKTLRGRETKLLNRIAKLETANLAHNMADAQRKTWSDTGSLPAAFPWERVEQPPSPTKPACVNEADWIGGME